MFEYGLSYVRSDFHLHTNKDKEFQYTGEQNSFVKDYVTALKQARIGVGIITNHNKFDKDEYDAIRKAAKKEGIFILPGVELTVKEGANGIHTLIVFNPDEWLSEGNNHIQTFLTTAFATIPNPENSNTKCSFDLKNTLEKLDAYDRDYFIVFAHVDQSSGLFAECKGGLLSSLSVLASFKKRVLGLQKATTRKNITQFQNCFGYIPALVEGSDPKAISDIGKGKKQTYLKIGEYSYSAVKFALQDYENRVKKYIPEIKHGYLESISFQGGKFDGQKISFSSELNTLIGIRGSGKSAVLEVVRYVLGLSPQTDEEYKESLIKSVLGSGGKATITAVDKHGKHYAISRIHGERINVLDDAGNDLNITPQSIFDGVQYFGQKDLSNSANHESGLLEKLVSGRIGQQAVVDTYVEELVMAVNQLLDVSRIPGLIEEVKIQQSEAEHKISIYKEKGVAEKLRKQASYTADQTKLDSAKDKISSVIKAIKKAYDNNSTVSEILSEHKSEYNKELVEEGQKILGLIDEKLSLIGKTLEAMQSDEVSFQKIIDTLSEQIDDLSDEFAEIKREIKDESLDGDTFVQLTADMEKIKENLRQLEEKSKTKKSIEASFSKAARLRNDALQKRYQAYQEETERINSNQNELHIEITFKGDREGFKAKLKSDFRGSGISDGKYQIMSEKFSDYVALVEDWILADGKELRSILGTSEYSKLDAKLNEQYAEFLGYQVKNKVEIYYHDKLLRQHSLGQRASALILFILSQDMNDIILIDQPEDDLDNKVIYDEVIKEISQKKSGSQFVFATHNANIPVLGDSERVLVAEYQDTRIEVLQGNIDLAETHKQIVEIMEGGQDAFKKRQLIYEAWR
ncbi:MAG: AAA family ATPase [Oscillospiraceae bacterium]|nr:AAA family ATPase [Oscillospiraceae bacterium]